MRDISDTVTIGCWAGFWGDTPTAAEQVLRGADIDYLVSDHLAEVTMALLARARERDPATGYIVDAVAALAPLLGEISRRSIRVVTNCGALNPAACARELRDLAQRAGVPLRIASVEGDDVSALLPELRRRDVRDMFTGAAVPESPLTANAYLGARAIAEALAHGADIIVTGRCADSAVVLGPLMHEFGWADDDFDLLSAGTLVGHVLECGPQALGGLFTDWEQVPGWEQMGYPVAECRRDGLATITKPVGTGGMVTPGTVAEQIVYEIADPGSYLMPDVICDWRDVRAEQVGPDRVQVSGAKGLPPTTTYKVTVTARDGYRIMTAATFLGHQAGARARRAGHALLKRAERLATEAGHEPLTETLVEVLGAGDGVGEPGQHDATREAVVRITARHPDRAALSFLGREAASMSLVAQGMTGFFPGRATPQPVIGLSHLLVDKCEVPVRVDLGDHQLSVGISPGVNRGVSSSPGRHQDRVSDRGDAESPAQSEEGPTSEVPLRQIAFARSGDKGNNVNIGVIARSPEIVPYLRSQLTSDVVAKVFGHWLKGHVERWEMPGLDAFNFLLVDVLGGKGGTSALRADRLGKNYAAILLDLPVTVPQTWLGSRPP